MIAADSTSVIKHHYRIYLTYQNTIHSNMIYNSFGIPKDKDSMTTLSTLLQILVHASEQQCDEEDERMIKAIGIQLLFFVFFFCTSIFFCFSNSIKCTVLSPFR